MKHLWIIVTGMTLLAIGRLVAAVMPLIGYAAFQSAAAGSYRESSYEVSLITYNAICIAIIGLGIFAISREGRGK